MAIPDEDVAQVRAATDLVALIGEHAALKRQGRRWTGLCPFHAEKTPSFSVNAEEGFYYCFGCAASGDAITFVRQVEHLDFVEAVRVLADRAGITLHEDATATREHRRRAELLDALERAVAWYHERLLSGADAGRARDYLRSRGYDGDVVRRFRLGWAPDAWDALASALTVPERVLSGSGLGFVNRRGRVQDSFRARIIFPICDPSGRPVALGGRILPSAPSTRAPESPGEPKYKNSAETAVYAKRRTLYALNWAKADVVAKGEVVVCEGYTDVIGCFGAGVPRAVATCGTALGEEHFTLLRNFAKRIVLAYDADSAGQAAVSRVYEWERRHEVDVAVADLPGGSDPGELARTDPEALRRAVADARPYLQFRVDRVLAAAALDTAEGRARAAERALAAVAEHPDNLVRDQYVMQIADRCRLDPTTVRGRLESFRQGAPRPSGSARPGAADPKSTEHGAEGARPVSNRAQDPGGDRPVNRPGLEALRLAVHRPGAVVGRLEGLLFVDPVQRQAFEALVGTDSLGHAIEHAPPDAAQLLRRIAVEEPLPADGALGDPGEAVVHQLIREATRRALSELGQRARTTPDALAAAAADAARARLRLEDLDRSERSDEAADWLLAWLLGQGECDR